MKQGGGGNTREENHMLLQPCDVPQKEAMKLHNLWMKDMGQWYFELAGFNQQMVGLGHKAQRCKEM